MNNSKQKNSIIFMLGMIIGSIIFVCIYGTALLNVTNDSLIINGYIEKDVAQHYTGWMLYRNSPWRFPLGLGSNIAWPYGTAVSYTDSIPLFAIFFKLFRSILPTTFQYFGLFVLLCFMLQGGFGALLSSLFSKNILTDCIAAAIFVFSPVMIERAFRHCALTAHFLILAALYYYFKNRGRTDFKAVIPFFVINALAITIHPYFLPFTFGIMFAFCVETFFTYKRYLSSILYILESIISTLAIGYIIGAFQGSGSMSTTGYGMFSMNLNALHNPISRGFDNWSAVLEIKPNISYQIEGFNYLGLGVIVFIPVAVVLYMIKYKTKRIAQALDFAKNFYGIIFSTAALLIFAVGDWISFGGLKIFRLPIPDFLTNGVFGIFRANGRFGWLLVYTIMLGIVYMTVTLSKEKAAALLLTILLAVQVVDMKGTLASKHNYFTSRSGDLQGQNIACIVKSSFWDIAAEKMDEVYRTYEPVDNSGIDIARKFAKQGKKVNTAFEARADYEALAAMATKFNNHIVNGSLEKGVLVLMRQCDDQLILSAKNNGYTVVFVDNIYGIFNGSFTAEEMSVLAQENKAEII